MGKTNKFPNGFTSWYETHFEIVATLTAIAYSKNHPKRILDAMLNEGRCGLYTLACDLTTQFEAENQDREWDGEWWEVLDDFLARELV
jgi:hypothetical protein